MAGPAWFAFPSTEALALALASGLVPPKVAAAPAQGARGADGRVLVRPKVRVPRQTREALALAGVVEVPGGPDAPRHVDTWPELIPPQRLVEALPGPGPVLFLLPPAWPLARLAGELWRLGCDRQRFAHAFVPAPGESRGSNSAAQAAAGDASLLLAIDPPTLPMLRALDHEDGLSAYRPTPSGQQAVWTELGYLHPLVERIDARDGLVLVHGDGRWTSRGPPVWTDLDAAARLQAPAPTPLAATTRDFSFSVPVRLVRGPEGDAPALWVLSEDPLREVEALVRALDEDQLDHLLFAAARLPDGTDLVVLRSRRAAGPLVVDVPGEAYVPMRALPRVHLPPRRMLDPPLRPHTLARLYCPEADRVAWLAPTLNGVARAHTLDEAAFHPLSRWVEYLIDRDAPALEAWVDRVRFDLEPFAVRSEDGPRAEASRKPVRKRTTARSRLVTADTEAPPAFVPAPPPAPSRAPRPLPAIAPLPQEPSGLERTRIELEELYLALPLPLDDPARAPHLVALARAYDALGHSGDASKCWARAMWEEPAPTGVAGEWARAELSRHGTGSPAEVLSAILDGEHCSQDDLRAVAAFAVATDAGEADPPLAAALRARGHQLQLTLERGDHALDARSRWLARAALARLAGDPLFAARAKDQALAELAGGLVIERDLPTLLRRRVRPGGAPGTAGADREQVVLRLERLRETWRTDDRARFPHEVAPEITGAYLDFLFAYALARLGKDEAARAMAAQAALVLPADNPVHAILAAMYQARVSQAIDGQPRHTPLPSALLARVEELDEYLRLRVNRLREWSAILEPAQTMVAWDEHLKDRRGPPAVLAEIDALRRVEDPAALAPRLAAVVERALEGEAPVLERVALAALELAPRLGERAAIRLVERLAPALARLDAGPRARCAECALYVAGHFGDTALARRILAELCDELDHLPDETFGALAPALCAGMRVLRRLGLEREGVALVDRLAVRAARHPRPIVPARLAQALGYFGRVESAQALVQAALDAIEAGNQDLIAQRELVRTTALALHQLPGDRALPGLDRLATRLAFTTDHFMTQSHFSLVAIHLVESIVFGLLGEELDLGDEGRRWLDTDELLVRRRIHADARRLNA